VFLVIRKKVLCIVAAFCACLLLMSVLPSREQLLESIGSDVTFQRLLIIDPGHGGEDGGTVAADGTREAAINLSLSLRLREIFFLAGIDTVMTREEDVSIHTEGDSVRARKASDIKNRVAIINSSTNPVLISIHQNSLPQAKSVHGAQVFFNTKEGSESLAKSVQDHLNRSINMDRAKDMRQIDSSVYLMRHCKCPAILVECGFLSNESDTYLLKTENHQKKIALTVAAGYLAWNSSGEQEYS